MGATKAPAPAKAAPAPARAPAPQSAPALERPVFSSTKSLLDLPVSDPRGTGRERARAIGAFRGPSVALPHRDQIERSFGRDLSNVRAHVGAPAGTVARELGANAFTMGTQIAFREVPTLRLAAHEAAHVVQQRSGLPATSSQERNADAIASRVVAGRSASDLLPRAIAAKPAAFPIQYEKPKKLTDEELDGHLSSVLDHWEQEATTRPIGPERAEARRVVLLLSFPPTMSTYAEADTFVDACEATAKDEYKTVAQLKTDASVDLDFFIDNGDAFPNWWADRIRDELYGTSNQSTLAARYQEARKEALVNTALISDEIWSSGLPITKQQAANLQRGSIVDLALSFENARKYPDERIGKYARLVVNWERTFHHYMLVQWFRFQLQVRTDLIRKGELVIDADNWKSVQATKFFNLKLQVFERAASTPDDMRAAFTALMLHLPKNFFRDPYGGGFRYDYPNEAVQAFWKEIQEVDRQLAGTDTPGRIFRSLEWAYTRGYFGEAALEVYEAIKSDWPWMLARLAAVFIAQSFPA